MKIPLLLRKYIQHLSGCPAGGSRCVCGHPINNHHDFTSYDKRQWPCAHCNKNSCPGFTLGKCICGLDKIINKGNSDGGN